MARRKGCTCKIEVPSTKGEFDLLCDLHDEGVAILAQVAILLKVVLLTRSRPGRTLVVSTTLFSRQRSVVHGIFTLSTTDTDGSLCGPPDSHNR